MIKKISITSALTATVCTGWLYFPLQPLSECPYKSYRTNYIFIYNTEDLYPPKKLKGAYFWNFNCSDNYNDIYDGKTSQNIYTSTFGLRVDWVDMKSFQSFPKSWYAKDKNNVYFSGKKLAWADVKSFLPFADEIEVIDMRLGRDDQYIYSFGKIISKNPSSFTYLGGGSFFPYFKDDKYAYINDRKIDWADAPTFSYLGSALGLDNALGKDKNNVYRWDKIIPYLNSRWLIYIDRWFYKNRYQVYEYKSATIVAWADPLSFRCDAIYEQSWVTKIACVDKNYIYREYIEQGKFWVIQIPRSDFPFKFVEKTNI